MTKKDKAIQILSSYQGKNYYILSMKKRLFTRQTTKLADWQIDYILCNYDKEFIDINRMVKITKWYGEKLQKELGTDFVPSKLKIYKLIGETDKTYHVTAQYRKSVEPQYFFIPKHCILTDMFSEDFQDFQVDFDKFDSITTKKDPNRKLREVQKDAVRFLLSRKRCILADDMGLGKTTSLSVAALEGMFESVLIICPASIKTTWKDELMWYVPESEISVIESYLGKNKAELEEYLGYKVGTSNKKVSELVEEAKGVTKWRDNHFVIVNYDIIDDFYSFTNARNERAALENNPLLRYIHGKRSLIIVDEAHRLSNSKSIRYKVIKKLIDKGNPDGVYLATGTPVVNDPSGLYNILKLLKHHSTADYDFYMEHYCGGKKVPMNKEERLKRDKITNDFCMLKGVVNWYGLTNEEKDELKEIVKWKVRHVMITSDPDPVNLEELKELISTVYLRRTKEDLGGMPNKTVHEIFYDLTEEQKEQYDRLWEEYEEAKKNENPDAELNKELLEGAIYRGYLSVQMVPHTIKLVDKLVSEGRKVIVACCYDEELYTLKEHYGDTCVTYNGKMNVKAKDKAKDAFINDPNVKIFIGNIDAASMGLTLIVSHDVVFNNISYTAALDKQMEDRVYRMGQKNDVDIYYQIFNGTQYRRMWDIVLRKDLLMNTLIKKESDK